MKKAIPILLILALIYTTLAGCAMPAGPQKPQETKEAPAFHAPEAEEPASPSPEAGAPVNLTLADIKKAAEAAGYIVSDGHQYILMDDLVGGITIEIVADNSHTLYSVAECATEEAAKKNAKEIDDAGYTHALRNGKFISSYDAENKGTERKALLSAILAGNPLPAPAYSAGAQSNAAQAQESSGSNLDGIPAYDPRAIPDDGVQKGEGFVENGTLYIKIRGVEKTQLGDKPGVILNYEMTNLSDEGIDTQTLYVEVLQSGEELRHPFTFEPVYLTITELAPGETLAFYDEYLLASETESIEARIRQFLVMVSNPPWVVQTFDLR